MRGSAPEPVSHQASNGHRRVAQKCWVLASVATPRFGTLGVNSRRSHQQSAGKRAQADSLNPHALGSSLFPGILFVASYRVVLVPRSLGTLFPALTAPDRMAPHAACLTGSRAPRD